jgi:hypothetical protein
MAGVEWIWVKGSDAEFIGLGDKIVDQLIDALADAMADVIQNAVANAKSLSADRVLTGAMISAIEGEVAAAGRDIAGKFGFLGDQQDYYVYQTVSGFHHWLGGQFIEPTFALRDAGEKAKGELVAAVRAAIASVSI